MGYRATLVVATSLSAIAGIALWRIGGSMPTGNSQASSAALRQDSSIDESSTADHTSAIFVKRALIDLRSADAAHRARGMASIASATTSDVFLSQLRDAASVGEEAIALRLMDASRQQVKDRAPLFIDGLRSHYDSVRYMCAVALDVSSIAATDASRHVLRTAMSPVEPLHIRMAAMRALSTMGLNDESVSELVAIAVANSSNKALRLAALRSLASRSRSTLDIAQQVLGSMHGERDAEVRSSLLLALLGGSDETRRTFGACLEAVSSSLGEEELLQAIARLVESEREVRNFALRYLQEHPAAFQVIDALGTCSDLSADHVKQAVELAILSHSPETSLSAISLVAKHHGELGTVSPLLLLPFLDSESDDVKCAAAAAIATLPGLEGTISNRLLRSAPSAVTIATLVALRDRRPIDRDLVDELRRLHESPRDSIAYEASLTLGSHEPLSLGALLRSTREVHRRAGLVVSARSRLSAEVTQALEEITANIENRSHARMAAVVLRTRVTSASEPADPLVMECLLGNDEDGYPLIIELLRERRVQLPLANLLEALRRVSDQFVQGLTGDSEYPGLDTIRTEIASSGATAAEHLVVEMARARDSYREQLRDILQASGSQAVPALVAGMRDVEIRRDCLEILAKLSGEAGDAWEPVIAVMRSTSEDNVLAAYVTAQIRPSEWDGLEQLGSFITGLDASRRVEAATCLGRAGRRALYLLPQVRGLAADADATCRDAGERAILAITESGEQ